MSRTLRYLVIVCSLSVSIWCTAVHLYFLFHASAARDDFNRGSVSGPLIQSVVQFHQSWSGRWSATALQIALARNVDLVTHYPRLLVPFTILFFIGCYAFVSLACRPAVSVPTRLVIAWFLFALIWLTLPEPGEVLYWLTGAVEYLLPIISSLIYFAWLRRAEQSPLRRLHATGLALSSILITGLHDILGLYLLCLLILILLYRLWRGMSLGLIPILILFAAVGFALTIFSPGVAARRAVYASLAPPDLAHPMIRGLLKTTQIFCAQFLLSPPLILASILFLSADANRILGTSWIDRDRPFFRVAFPVLTVVSPLGLMLVVMLGGLYDPPPRLISASFMIFIFGWVLSLVVWMPTESEKTPRLPRSRRLIALAAFLLFLSFFTSGNSYRAASDAVMRLRPWTNAIASRNALMRQAAAMHLDNIPLSALPPKPLLYPDAELFPNPSHPLNQGYAAYFGVGSVELSSINSQ